MIKVKKIMENTRELSEYYTVEDLNDIFVSGKEKFTNNPTQIPLKQISDIDFEQWAKKRFQHLIPDDVLEHFGNVWNYHDRVWLLNRMSEVLGRPSAVLRR